MACDLPMDSGSYFYEQLRCLDDFCEIERALSPIYIIPPLDTPEDVRELTTCSASVPLLMPGQRVEIRCACISGRSAGMLGVQAKFNNVNVYSMESHDYNVINVTDLFLRHKESELLDFHFYYNAIRGRCDEDVSTLFDGVMSDQNVHAMTEKCAHACAIFLVRSLSTAEMIKRVKASTLNQEMLRIMPTMFAVKRTMQQYVGVECVPEDDRVCRERQMYMRISIADPVTGITMRYPGRGMHCTHLRCFDVRSAIIRVSQNPDAPKMVLCPLCYKVYSLGELYVDSVFASIASTIPEPMTTTADLGLIEGCDVLTAKLAVVYPESLDEVDLIDHNVWVVHESKSDV